MTATTFHHSCWEYWSLLLLLISPVVSNSDCTQARDANHLKIRYGATAYNFTDCYVRWQIIQPGQTAKDARVTELNWAETEFSVTATLNNMYNTGGTNAQLWFEGGNYALQYAGLITDPCILINPQIGLDGPNVVASLILPPGVAKLKKIEPDDTQLSQQNTRSTSGIFGVALSNPSQPLAPTDYLYIINEDEEDKGVKTDLKKAFKTRKYPIYVNGITSTRETIAIEFDKLRL